MKSRILAFAGSKQAGKALAATSYMDIKCDPTMS